MTSSLQRVVTAAVGAPLVLAAAWYGGWPFAALVCVAALVGQYEIYRLAGVDRQLPTLAVGLCAGAAILLRVQVGPPMDIVVPVLLAALVATFVLLHGRDNVLLTASAALAGVIYPPVLLSYIAVVRASEALPGIAQQLTMLTIIGVWAADTVAYLVGRRIGRHRMAAVSPAKTWEGFAGGVAGAVVVVATCSAAFGPLGPVQTAFIGLACGVVGPAGDLAESALKRSAGAKDSGGILPGHGGLLDRLDALILVSPVIYGWAMICGFL